MNGIISFPNRLNDIKNHLGISSERKFAEAIGISYSNYQSYKRGSSPSLDKLIDILSNVKNLNPDWLVFGNGLMFKESEITHLIEEEENELALNRADFEFLKQQVRDLTEINKNLSYIVREKSTAGTARIAPVGKGKSIP